METKILRVKDIKGQYSEIVECANIIKDGGIVAFPTETVYGLGANALDSNAVKKIFLAKGRPQDNPLIIHVSDKNINKYVSDIPEIAKKLMEAFWPGPLTIILNKKSIVPSETSANLDTIGIRMPNNEIALKLIELSGVPIAAPSANISGRPSPTDIERCIEDLNGKIDYIIGGEKSDVGVESTIVDCTSCPPLVLRPGGITLEMLRKIDNSIDIDNGLKNNNEDFKPKAPGMKYKHYAPKGKVIIIKGKEEKVIEKIKDILDSESHKRIIVLTSDENKDKYKFNNIITLGSKNKPEIIAKNLFESLRICDDRNAELIICEAFQESGIGAAIMNRLSKAAGYNIINVY